MSTVKNIRGDYTINSINSSDKVNINTSLVTINGNLLVNGNTTTINTTTLDVQDNTIVLNSNLWANTAPSLDAGILINRGSYANVELKWNESIDAWQITNDGSTYANIATTSSSGGIEITANLDMHTYTIYSGNTDYLHFADNVAIQNTPVAPGAIAGNTVVYAQSAGSGGSGIYVSNDTYTEQELATRSKAIAFSIIFG